MNRIAPMPESLSMSSDAEFANCRVLVIDDNPAIHRDFDKILRGDLDAEEVSTHASMAEIERILLGDEAALPAKPLFNVDFALQGRQGVDMVAGALNAGRPYAMAFIDMRMPP